MVNASPTSSDLLDEFFPDLFLALWTTIPWTIPVNAAVAVNAKLQYAIVKVKSSVDDSSSDNKKETLGNVLKRQYVHPIDNRECPVVIGGEYITTESGTGLVHTAPGHGQEDYVTGLKYELPLLSPVDDDGNFTEQAGQFSGLNVLGDGNIVVVKCLNEQMSLIMIESYNLKYPYDWRTKKPTIFRAIEQWFASVEGFREAVMGAIGHVKWVPPQAENRISAMTSSPSDWCISSKRTWGVPIPVFYHVNTKESLMYISVV